MARIPRAVWALGFVSLLMDISSEIVHSLLPVFMVGTLGASAFMLGLVEGGAEATGLIVRVISGAWSDRMGQRKPLALAGYAIGALSKPLFALSGSAGAVLGARLFDRVGKGIRVAPRDALVADLTEPDIRGAADGLRQALDTIGGFLGPNIAIGLMLLWPTTCAACSGSRSCRGCWRWWCCSSACRSLRVRLRRRASTRCGARP